MADLEYTQPILIGDSVINTERHEVIREWGWDLIKTICVPIAGAFLLFLAYSYGQSHPDCNANCQPMPAVATPAPATTTPTVSTDRLASVIERLAEARPVASTANLTSTPTTQAVPPPTVVVKMPDHLTLEVKDSNPSPQAKADSAPPASVVSQTTMTPEQQCIDEVIRLRRNRQCN